MKTAATFTPLVPPVATPPVTAWKLRKKDLPDDNEGAGVVIA